jgi:hypothetical protein
MATVRLKIDVSGTVGDEAWRNLRQFGEIQSASFGPQFGCGCVARRGGLRQTMNSGERTPAKDSWGNTGRCEHLAHVPHPPGEWIGAELRLATPLLAQYAVSHYLEQERVLDADVVDGETW